MQTDINLDPQMLQRIAELEQALKFELMLRRITEKVRASLDENHILQATVNELALELEADCFATLASNMEQQTFISHPPTLTSMPDCQTGIISPTSNPEIEQQLRQGRDVHFCSNTSSFQGKYTFFACPIVNGSESLATLWVIWDISRTLKGSEIYLMQQVANQCALSIHQARLYQAAQKQVEELNRLNEVKNDFLIRATHDLRAPLSNMQLSIHLLEHQLTEGRLRCGNISQENSACSKTLAYVKILQAECKAEIRLINDLLDLQKLEAGKLPLDVCEIDLEYWLKELVEPLEEQMQQRQLTMELHIPSNLPALISEPASLHRIMSELLHNAYKYTPPHEKISVAVLTELEQVQIRISNSGVEIPTEELPLIFDKFYRVRNGDRWKQGGTGLGLALVKNLVKYLGGSIEVESKAMQTCFIINLPLNSANSLKF